MSALRELFQPTAPVDTEPWELRLVENAHSYVELNTDQMAWLDATLRDVERDNYARDETRDFAHSVREALASALDDFDVSLVSRGTFDQLCQVMSVQRLALRRLWNPSNFKVVTEETRDAVLAAFDAHDALLMQLLDGAAW